MKQNSATYVPDKSTDLAIVEQLAHWLDAKFVVPGLGIRFGIDAIVGLIPGFGDALTSLLSFYILSVANRHNVPRVTQARMAANIALDWVVGIIPLVGDLFDVTWKANTRNAILLKRHLLATVPEQNKHKTRDWFFLSVLAIILFAVLAGVMFVAYWMLSAVWGAIVG